MRRAARVGPLAAAALVLTTGLTACEDPADDASGGGKKGGKEKTVTASATFTEQKLSWKDCPAATPMQGTAPKPKPLSDGTRFECADMKAPLDWSKQDGKTIDIALIRAKAKDSKRRLGSLVYNFGGPGASGVAMLPNHAPQSYMKLHSRYDLVSFDPRGIGESDGVRCLDDKAVDASGDVDATPETPAEEKRATALMHETTEACRKNSGDVLPHVDTRSTARDMDLMRQVLGDKKLNYFGISYGTQLGGVYAHLYPKNVGKAVFDAVVDPTMGMEQDAKAQAAGFHLALSNFLKACADVGEECPTGTDPKQGMKKVEALLKKLDRKPLPTQDGRKLNETRATNGIVSALYSEASWGELVAGLQEALSGTSGDTLLMLGDRMAGRDDKGRYANTNNANAAVNCADQKQRFTRDDVHAKLPEMRKASPIFGPFTAWGLLGCSEWPVDGASDETEVSAPGAAPILVIGTTGDPATPFEGAKRMAQGLGKGVGIHITNQGEGHGAYGAGKCATKAVDGYLLGDKVPSDGLVCKS
ncbi:alpha/beta hydrolase [Streptomyces sp. NPDC047108]|uniref:alpha/beta hydrolase n=1 Tax=Streptomyces sp. NPDC047108 TaxID=3155025 RepID=UPI0034035981